MVQNALDEGGGITRQRILLPMSISLSGAHGVHWREHLWGSGVWVKSKFKEQAGLWTKLHHFLDRHPIGKKKVLMKQQSRFREKRETWLKRGGKYSFPTLKNLC